MILGGLQRTTTIDFPGNVACVVFTRGCDLDCFYCHNRELITPDGDEHLDEDEFFAFLEKRKGLLDGVVVSGGEPTIQKDLLPFLERIRSYGYNVKLDTNGMHPDVVKEVIAKGLADYFAVDIKAPESECVGMCGKNAFEKEKETVGLLLESGVKFEVRTTLYPGLTLSGLVRLLSSLPEMPLWRMNYFKMPRAYREECEDMLYEKALKRSDLERCEGHLKSLQENILI